MDSRESARSPRRRLRTLAKPAQFRRCYGGRKFVTRYAVVFVESSAEPDDVQVGVVASRKVGGAVQRNRAKRLLRESARRFVPRLGDRRVWIVLVAKASIVGRSAGDVRDDIEQALEANGLLATEDTE